MKTQPLPFVAIDTGLVSLRDYRKVASILRGHLREKRKRMTLTDLANMIGDVKQCGSVMMHSPIHEAMAWLVDLGLVRMVGRHYEATDVIVTGIWSDEKPLPTVKTANVSQSPRMAIRNQRLRTVRA